MRSFTINRDGSGNGPESDHINRGFAKQTELEFYDSLTIKVEQTTRGVRFHAKIPPASPTTTTTVAGFNPRGYWLASPPSPYMTFDWVQYGTGTAAGSYYSTIDGNTNAPDSGIGWVQMATSAGTCL